MEKKYMKYKSKYINLKEKYMEENDLNIINLNRQNDLENFKKNIFVDDTGKESTENDKINAKQMLNFRICLTKWLKENVDKKYDWNSAFIRWIFNVKQIHKKYFIIPKKIQELIPKLDIEYIKKKSNSKINLDKKIYDFCLDIIDIDFNKEKNIYNKAYNRLKKINDDNKLISNNELDSSINDVISMYDSIGSLNSTIFLSVPPKIIEYFKFVELFGSPFNFTSNEYYSPLPIDTEFGSKGNMFDVIFENNKNYLANPPFDEHVIFLMADKIIRDLKKTDLKNISIVITIPVWDNKTQIDLGLKPYGFGFPALDLLIAFKKDETHNYNITHAVLNKNEYKYWSFSEEKYIPASHSHLIVISNNDINVKKVSKKWLGLLS
jgi:hypothetical protein